MGVEVEVDAGRPSAFMSGPGLGQGILLPLLLPGGSRRGGSRTRGAGGDDSKLNCTRLCRKRSGCGGLTVWRFSCIRPSTVYKGLFAAT